MAFGLSFVAAPWRVALSVLGISLLMTVIYDYAFFLPLGIRNLAGIILFLCIMLGAPVAYLGARCGAADSKKAVKIGLLIPVLWHLKEIWMAGKLFGFAEGFYAGLQGFYLFYYALMIFLMGIVHFGYALYQHFRGASTPVGWMTTGYFLLPMLALCFVELLVYRIAGLDLFMFQGYLQGYRYFFM